MLKRNLHNKPSSEKQGQFSFVNVVCSREGQGNSCPEGLAQEMPPTLTPSLRTKNQEASLETLGEKKFVPAITISKPLDSMGDWAPLAV